MVPAPTSRSSLCDPYDPWPPPTEIDYWLILFPPSKMVLLDTRFGEFGPPSAGLSTTSIKLLGSLTCSSCVEY